MKVMIVDNHNGMRRMFYNLLSARGIDLAECADGSAALTLYKEFQPDWVFMDGTMEKVDGLAATRLLRSHFPGAHVLMVSQEDIGQLRRAARAAGACGFITKDRLLQSLTKERELPWRELETQWLKSDANLDPHL